MNVAARTIPANEAASSAKIVHAAPVRGPWQVDLVAALALTAVSGILYGISFPPLALRPLAWVALIPFLLAIRGGSLRRALLLGTLWAFVMTFVTSDCLPGAVINYYKQSVAIGWLMLFGATVVTMVPYYAPFAAAYGVLARRPGGALPLLAGAAWVAAELARVTVLGGNPWAVSGYSQTGVVIMQLADLGGVHLASFLLVAFNASLVELLLARRDGSLAWRRGARRGALTVAVLLVLAVAYGVLHLHGTPGATAEASTGIAIAQGNLDLGRQWRRDMYGRNLDDYLRLTNEATADGTIRLVFWPESAMTFFLNDEPAYQRALGRVLAPRNLELIAGGPRVVTAEDGENSHYYNATFLISPQGNVVAWQDKTKLLPFAEYFPLESIDLLRRDFGQANQFTPGEQRPPLPTIAGKAGVVVCNESMYPEIARERVATGAEYLVNPANDSWFSALKYSLQAFDIARWRAVETRRYLVRTSTAGPSAIVDPQGRIVVETAPFSRGWVTGAIGSSRTQTLYQRTGDAFAALCAVAALAGLLLALARPHAAEGA